MDEPIQVEVTRDDVVEALHTVHAVAVRDGQIVAQAGDPRGVTLLRSAAKPIQALPLVRSRPELADRELAIACASHGHRPEQLDAVRTLLKAAPATAADLETGPDPTPLEHTCSGKHAGFLVLCRDRGYEMRDYRLASHPLQRELLVEVAAAAEVDPASMPLAIDGCGVPTFGLPLDRCAHAFARLPRLDGGARLVAAIGAHPEMLLGVISADATFVRAFPGWVSKGGAEGLFCAGAPDGLGIAVKVEDGAFRAILPALAAFLSQLGIDPGDLGIVTVENSRGEPVGAVRTRLKSRVPKR